MIILVIIRIKGKYFLERFPLIWDYSIGICLVKHVLSVDYSIILVHILDIMSFATLVFLFIEFGIYKYKNVSFQAFQVIA